MDLFITSDSNQETELGKIIINLSRNGYKDFFNSKKYGLDIGLSIVLMCRNKDLDFKQRIRFDKKDNKLRFDIMFNYDNLVKLNYDEKCKKIASKLLIEVPEIIKKYKFKDFDLIEFEKDFKTFFENINWL